MHVQAEVGMAAVPGSQEGDQQAAQGSCRYLCCCTGVGCQAWGTPSSCGCTQVCTLIDMRLLRTCLHAVNMPELLCSCTIGEGCTAWRNPGRCGLVQVCAMLQWHAHDCLSPACMHLPATGHACHASAVLEWAARSREPLARVAVRRCAQLMMACACYTSACVHLQ